MIELTKEQEKELQLIVERLYSIAYRAGYTDCTNNLAVWQDGEQYVGVMKTPLKTALKQIEDAKIPIRY